MAESRIEIEEFRIERFMTEEDYSRCGAHYHPPKIAVSGAKLIVKGFVRCRMFPLDGCNGTIPFEKVLAYFTTDYIAGRTTPLGQAKGTLGLELLKKGLETMFNSQEKGFDPFYKPGFESRGLLGPTVHSSDTVTCSSCGAVYAFPKALSDVVVRRAIDFVRGLKSSDFPPPFPEHFPPKELNYQRPVIERPDGKRITPTWFLDREKAKNDPIIKALRKLRKLDKEDSTYKGQLHGGKEEKPS